jgi:MYXO-CTERM domain-containing protein
MMKWRFAATALFALALSSACSSGGCSGCTLGAIPDGFDSNETIPNAASVRLTRGGLDFIGKNVGAVVSKFAGGNNGLVTFDIPEANFEVMPGTTMLVCPKGVSGAAGSASTCKVKIDFGKAKLRVDGVAPSSLRISGTLPLVVDDIPLLVPGSTDRIDIALGEGKCVFNKDASYPKVDFKAVPLDITIPLITAPNGATQIDIEHLTAKADLVREHFHACDQHCWNDADQGQTCKDTDEGMSVQLQEQLSANLDKLFKPLLRDKLCKETKEDGDAGEAGESVTCDPKLLGKEGVLDVGGFLAKFAPGVDAKFDLHVAAHGAIAADDNGGATLAVSGGFAIPKDSKAPATCIPDDRANPVPRDIQLPDELKKDGPHHVGVAIAERFVTYALTNLYKRCVLSIGITTDTAQELHSGVLSILLPSMNQLTDDQKAASIAIVTRPSAPPKVTIGDNPQLRLGLERFAVDIFVWSSDRYVKAFTWTADVEIPITLQTGVSEKNPKGGLLPVFGKFVITNSDVSDTTLLFEDPKMVAQAIAQMLPAFMSQMVGRIDPIDINAALAPVGLGLDLPKDGIRKLTKGNDTFLGVFGNVSVPAAPHEIVETNAELSALEVHPEAMALETLDAEKAPVLRAHLGSSRDDVEYAWWIDNGTRSAWSPNADAVVAAPEMVFQGKHTLHVVSRVKGRTATEDLTPAKIPFVIDTIPPKVVLREESGGLSIDAWDFVSADHDLVERHRIDGGFWTPWMPLLDIGTLRTDTRMQRVEVEVRDENGNIGRADEEIERGGPPPKACGCDVPGGTTGTGPAFFGVLGAVGLMLARRRRSLVLLGLLGCSSDPDAKGPEPVKTGCGKTCTETCQSPLPAGLIGSYTSIATASDGTVWVAGYNDLAVVEGTGISYGDLVVGKYDGTSVAWQTVDGLPPARTDGSCVVNDPKGWRGGETDPGDNVGQWTSLQVGEQPMVSYFDATHDALKFAAFDGEKWATHTVAQPKERGGEAGRYAKLVLVDGQPVIAYLAIDKGEGGKARSRIVVARASTKTPSSPSDWKMEDVQADESGACRAGFCDGNTVCAPDASAACLPKATDCKDCSGDGKACALVDAKATCVTTLSERSLATYPRVFGAYIDLAVDDNGKLGIIAYDRLHGGLLGFAEEDGAWKSTVLDPTSTGDLGVGSSLRIAKNGDWHVSYASGFVESLKYLTVPGGPRNPPKVEVVDDGTALDGTTFGDGKHRVGDDSSLALDGDKVTIVYQDATAGTLRIATRSGDGAFKVRAIASKENQFAGYFPRLVGSEIAHWWRATDPATKTMEGDVAFVKP